MRRSRSAVVFAATFLLAGCAAQPGAAESPDPDPGLAVEATLRPQIDRATSELGSDEIYGLAATSNAVWLSTQGGTAGTTDAGWKVTPHEMAAPGYGVRPDALPLDELFDAIGTLDAQCPEGAGAYIDVVRTGAVVFLTGCQNHAWNLHPGHGTDWLQVSAASIDGESMPDLVGATLPEALQTVAGEASQIYGDTVNAVEVCDGVGFAIEVRGASTPGQDSYPAYSQRRGVPFDPSAARAGPAFDPPHTVATITNDGTAFDPAGLQLVEAASEALDGALAKAGLCLTLQLVDGSPVVKAAAADDLRTVFATVPVPPRA